MVGRGESSCLGSTYLPSCHPLSHLHEGMEERVIVLLLSGVSHGLLHFQAVLDIGLEPLADLEERGRGVSRQGKKVMRYRFWLQSMRVRVYRVGWGVEKASHRPVVQLLPTHTSHDCQPFSLDLKEEWRT